MPISTMGLGVDDGDNVIEYVPPGTSVVDQGNTITNGQYQSLPAGDVISWEGVIQFPSGSGTLSVLEGGEVVYRTVTITMPS